jgi:hypothetical protein
MPDSDTDGTDMKCPQPHTCTSTVTSSPRTPVTLPACTVTTTSRMTARCSCDGTLMYSESRVVRAASDPEDSEWSCTTADVASTCSRGATVTAAPCDNSTAAAADQRCSGLGSSTPSRSSCTAADPITTSTPCERRTCKRKQTYTCKRSIICRMSSHRLSTSHDVVDSCLQIIINVIP